MAQTARSIRWPKRAYKLVLNRSPNLFVCLFVFLVKGDAKTARPNGSVTSRRFGSPHRPGSRPRNTQRTGRQPAGGLQSEGGRKKRRRDDFLPKSAEAVWGGEAEKSHFLPSETDPEMEKCV